MFDLIKEDPFIIQNEISIILNKSESTIWVNMKKLQDMHLIKRVGTH
ncbi:MAG: winged helix-turn-helix domain-containing protein [Bacillota bacterium]